MIAEQTLVTSEADKNGNISLHRFSKRKKLQGLLLLQANVVYLITCMLLLRRLIAVWLPLPIINVIT